MDSVQLGWAKKDGYAVCLMCKARVNPNMSSMLAHVDAKHREMVKGESK